MRGGTSISSTPGQRVSAILSVLSSGSVKGRNETKVVLTQGCDRSRRRSVSEGSGLACERIINRMSPNSSLVEDGIKA